MGRRSHGFHLCARKARRFPWTSLSSGAFRVSGLGKTHMRFSKEVGRVLAGAGDVQQRASSREGDSKHPESP